MLQVAIQCSAHNSDLQWSQPFPATFHAKRGCALQSQCFQWWDWQKLSQCESERYLINTTLLALLNCYTRLLFFWLQGHGVKTLIECSQMVNVPFAVRSKFFDPGRSCDYGASTSGSDLPLCICTPLTPLNPPLCCLLTLPAVYPGHACTAWPMECYSS